MNVLALSAHTDDIEVGCAGTIARLVGEGHKVKVLALSNCGEEYLRLEMASAMECLGIEEDNYTILDFERRKFPQFRQQILQVLYDLNKSFHPQLVFCPSSSDIHQDHHTLYEETRRAFKHSTIQGYFIDGNCISFHPNCYYKLQEEHVVRKLGALQCYKSQLSNPYRMNYFEIDGALSSLKHWGKAHNCRYAETFEMIVERN